MDYPAIDFVFLRHSEHLTNPVGMERVGVVRISAIVFPRGLAHVQIVKNRSGYKLESVEIRYAHGSKKRIDQALRSMGYNVPNTSAIERRNGTARLMNAVQVRKTLAFSRDPEQKEALGWWALTVYNWCRPHRSLKTLLAEPIGKKSTNRDLRPWPSV